MSSLILKELGLTREAIMRHVVRIAPPVHDAYNVTRENRKQEGLLVDGRRPNGKRPNRNHPELAHLRCTNPKEYHRLVMAKYRRLAKERMNTPND